MCLSEANTCLGYLKSRPLTAVQTAVERVPATLHLEEEESVCGGEPTSPISLWFKQFVSVCKQPILLDRHFLRDIESRVGIASAVVCDQRGVPRDHYTSADVRATLDHDLDFRELPVALLRLHFTGRDRLHRWLRQISLPHFRLLFSLCSADQPPPPTLHTYEDTLAYVAQELTNAIDLCLCSFERCLRRLLSLQVEKGGWPSFGMAGHIDSHCDPYWANMPMPPPQVGAASYNVWTIVMWRLHISRLLETVLAPWDDWRQEEWVRYELQLYRDSHLDLLTEMSASGQFEDSLLLESGRLADFYPNCHRICCAEELPAFHGYSFDNFKTGANLKERCSLRDKIGHIFINKPMNNICKVRNLDRIIRRYGRSDPIIIDLVRLVVKCVMLGNLPHTRGSLNLIARIRVNHSFRETAPPEKKVGEVHPTPSSPAKPKKKKAKKRKRPAAHSDDDGDDGEDGEDEDEDDGDEEGEGERNWLGFTRRRHTILAMLREFLFYKAESSGCFDEVLSWNNKWHQYKCIARLGNGKLREELSRQCALSGTAPIDWSQIEWIHKKDEYDIKTGIIMQVHILLLRTAQKVKKDSFENIIMKKMTSIEETIACAIDTAEEMERASLPPDGLSLDQLHFLCWYMAGRPRLETRWFQVMGMTREGLGQVRDWLFCYYIYDIPDNRLKKSIKAFQRRSMTDYIIFKRALRLILLYRRDYLFPLPRSMAERQTLAQRRQLMIDPWRPTPDKLGVTYECTGCRRFATAVVSPLLYEPALRRRTLVNPISKSKGQNGLKLLCQTAQPATTPITTTQSPPTTAQQEAMLLEQARQQSLPQLTFALYNMVDQGLYCARNYKKKKNRSLKQLQAAEDDKDRHVIMRSKNNKIIIESNLSTHRQSNGEKGDDEEDDDDEDEDEEAEEDEEMMTLEHEEHLFMPDDVTRFSNMRLAWDLANRPATRLAANLKGEEGAGEGGSTTTPSSTAGAKRAQPAVKRCNKFIFTKIVNNAIHQRFNCATRLVEVDATGVVKNGCAYCTDCDMMTEVTNYNFHSYGLTCGRHATPSHNRDHPVWQIDRFALAHRDMDLNAPFEPMTGSRHRKPLQQKKAVTHTLCPFCRYASGTVTVPVMDANYCLSRVPICRACRGLAKLHVDKNRIPQLPLLRRYVKARLYHVKPEDTKIRVKLE